MAGFMLWFGALYTGLCAIGIDVAPLVIGICKILMALGIGG